MVKKRRRRRNWSDVEKTMICALARFPGVSVSQVARRYDVIANGSGLQVKAVITGGEASDYTGYGLLVDEDLPQAEIFIADKGYGADAIRDDVKNRGGTPVVWGRSNRKKAIPLDGLVYTLRNLIERCINKLKCARRLSTRYDKTAQS